MRKTLSVIFAAGLLLTLQAASPVEGLWQPPRKKIIDMSWSNPRVQWLKDNYQRIEKCAPVDGITISVIGEKVVDGKKVPVYGNNPWNPIPWKYEYFARDIADLKAMKFTKFTDNFLFMTTYSANVDWFADKDWEEIANHFGIAARIAKETGMKGLMIDPEEYSKHFWCEYKGHSHADAVKIARKRGQQVGEAIFREYPDAKLFCLFLFSFDTYLKGDAWTQTLSHSFFNGIYDVLPPTATMIEGHEYFGYFAKSRADFDKLRVDVDRTFMHRVAASNIKKYRSQTQLAAPLYIDSYFPTCGVYKYLKPEIEKTPLLKFIRQQLTWALDVSDEYVWIYSENGAWWPKSAHPKAQKTWEEVCPGINNVINSVHNPAQYTLNGATNLLQIPELDKEPGNWSFWTAVKNDGNGGWKDGLIYLDSVTRTASVHQTVPIKAGKNYMLRVKARKRTPISGNMSMYAGFRDTSNAWMSQKKTVYLDIDTNGQWRTLTMFIEAPPKAGKLSFQLQVQGLKKGECAEFKEPELFEL